MQTQRPALRIAAPTEEVIQFSLSLRKSLRKQLARLADDADMTMRAFVLEAWATASFCLKPGRSTGGSRKRRPMLADQFHAAAAAARNTHAVDEVARLTWRAHGEGQIGDLDATAIAEAVGRPNPGASSKSNPF
jgi:hypothetical protein